MPFNLPPTPYPYSPIPTPVPFQPPFAHGHPQPIVPPGGAFVYGHNPHVAFPWHMNGRLPRFRPEAPMSARERCSRSSSRRSRKRLRRAGVETESSEETRSVNVDKRCNRLPGDIADQAQAQASRSMEAPLQFERLPLIDPRSEEPHRPLAHPERGRAKYRLVSPTASHAHSGRNDQYRTGISTCGEGGEVSNNSTSRPSTRSNPVEQRNTKATPEQHSDIPVAATPVPLPMVETQTRQEPLEIRLLPTGPPLNAPTAPASQRRLVNSNPGKPQTSLARNSSETGSWSQSKRWISQETKERTLFQKLMHNLHYMGADQSPFVPKTPATLAAFRIAEKEIKSRVLTRQLQTKMESLSKRKKEEAEGCKNTALVKIELFQGREMADDLSPVFASNTCFRKTSSADKPSRPPWPSLAELKEEGDKRAARYGRFFPLPRVDRVFERIAVAGGEDLYNTDGTISWEKKQVKLHGRFVQPVTPEEEGPVDVSAQIGISEVHKSLQTLMREIDNIDADNMHENHEVDNIGWRTSTVP